MRLSSPIVLCLSALAWAAAASAASPPPPAAADVTVGIGPALQKKLSDFGARDVTDLETSLRDAVQRAIAHSRSAPPVRADLVIEDATPNRPTFEQLGRTPGLSFRSVGLGGARISGTIVYADGALRPIREQYYETELRDVEGFDTWYDADRAIDLVAYDISKGRLPDTYRGPGPTGDGHFGDRFNTQP